ncbi:hypothetical protein [Paraclostridium sordellii]|uniref:hypothetical protein n=1 Tax=Paraclostridium sordellii TaxID=1505 RepID=UPI0005E23AA6|nr:hypothetical protein [Paeniclostridium sordellii]CEQ15161.1 Uncharacterized protein with a C-terminal OMP (outer membrane protein) domain [[Clostridium] sordellii] [Paeniclostridium sordellii]
MGKLGKFLACVGGAAVAVVAAPVVLPAAAAAAGTVAAGAAAAGSAIAGSAVGTAVAGAATAAGSAVASSAVGTAVAGAAATATGVATAAGAAVASSAAGTAVAGAATALGGALAAGAGAVGVTTTATAALGAATVGAGLTYSGMTSLEGFSNSIEADEKILEAKNIYEEINNKLDSTQNKTIDKMRNLNKLKISIYANEIMESIEVIEKIKNIKQTDTTISEFKFKFTPEEIKEVKKISIEASNIAKGSIDGLGTSAAMSSLTTSLVANFGVASTGTAISSLSGAAAQRATLAALGGGAINAGGAGMAGGQVMLGGISLVPTVIIMSHKYAQNAERKLTEATRYYSQIREEVGKIEGTISWIENSVNVRVDEIYNTLENFRNVYSKNILWKLKDIRNGRCKDGKININECTNDEKKVIVKSCSFISSMKEIIKAPILTENGLINEETKSILDVYGDINKLYV